MLEAVFESWVESDTAHGVLYSKESSLSARIRRCYLSRLLLRCLGCQGQESADRRCLAHLVGRQGFDLPRSLADSVKPAFKHYTRSRGLKTEIADACSCCLHSSAGSWMQGRVRLGGTSSPHEGCMFQLESCNWQP